MATSQDFVNWVCGPSLDPNYLKYVLLGERESLLTRFASGTTHQTIYYPEAKAFHVLLPPLSAQQRIVRVLGALDDKIDLNRRTNETLESMARAIFQSWFVDFDPVRAKAAGQRPAGLEARIADLFPNSFEDSEFGDAPKGWPVESLGAHVDMITGFPFASEAFTKAPPGLRLLRGTNVGPGAATWGDVAFWSENLDERTQRCLLCSGDIVLAMDRPWIPAGLKLLMVGPHDVPCLLVQRVARLRGSRTLPTSLLYMELRDQTFTQHLLSTQTGSTIPHISSRDILRYRFVLPPVGLAEAFDRLAAPLIERRLRGASESARLAELRDNLLPKLLSGELRVPEAERAVEAAL